jgi:hypothetical protein
LFWFDSWMSAVCRRLAEVNQQFSLWNNRSVFVDFGEDLGWLKNAFWNVFWTELLQIFRNRPDFQKAVPDKVSNLKCVLNRAPTHPGFSEIVLIFKKLYRIKSPICLILKSVPGYFEKFFKSRKCSDFFLEKIKMSRLLGKNQNIPVIWKNYSWK